MHTHRQLIQVLALVTFALSMASSAVAQAPCTAITFVPYTISAPGAYCLTADITTAMTSGTAITINANSVTLDLNGHKLAGNAGVGTLTSGITAAGRKYIVVRNGTIRGFLYGVVFTGSVASVIEDVIAEGNHYCGLTVEGVGLLVRRNAVVNTGGTTVLGPNTAGIAIIAVGSVMVRDNDIASVVAMGTGTATGVYADGSVIISDNRFANLTRAIQCSSLAPKYRDNLTSGVTTLAYFGTDAGGNN